MGYPLTKNRKWLYGSCLIVTQEVWDSSNEKINRKLSKNVWQSTQDNHKNGSSVSQKETK